MTARTYTLRFPDATEPLILTQTQIDVLLDGHVPAGDVPPAAAPSDADGSVGVEIGELVSDDGQPLTYRGRALTETEASAVLSAAFSASLTSMLEQRFRDDDAE